MKKTNLTPKEICEKAFSAFETRDYGPKFLNDDRTEFGCLINGISFSFCLLEDDLFWFGAEFEPDQEISAAEREALEKSYMQISPEDVVFMLMEVKFACQVRFLRISMKRS